ncbi:glycosyltransferase, partial [Lutibacter sp.]
MKFTIITHAAHKIKAKNIFAYEPYVREMNLWLKYVDEVQIVAPISEEKVTSIESKYQFNKRHSEPACREGRQREAISPNEQITSSQAPRNDEPSRHPQLVWGFHDLKYKKQIPNRVGNDGIELIPIQSFDIKSLKNGITAIFRIPKVLLVIYKSMKWADHIHLRCPGNIGLLGCFVQILFPNKPKTIKYAGNWDPKSKQPLSYRIQKWLLSNTFLTRNAKVLAYGEWPYQTATIIPFFTASYSEREILERRSTLDAKSHKYNFLFVGGLTIGKQPLLSVQVIHQLKEKGYAVQLDIYGEGKERNNIEKYIEKFQLQRTIQLHGNVDKEIVKKAYQKADFLLFISKSEGWPKVIAEAMFWGCLPISSGVSCIPYMLGDGTRGTIVDSTINEIVSAVESYLANKKKYNVQVKEAMKWSRQYTLEKFEEEIGKLLKSPLKRGINYE